MKTRFEPLLLVGLALAFAVPASAQPPRPDAIWARSTNGAPIVLDGVLDEPAWATAESKIVRYGIDNGIPGSGYQEEGGRLAKDSTYAVLKFLTVGNKLYLGAFVRDSSVGGSKDFNRFDGILMSLKDHSQNAHPAPPAEYIYSWWYQADSAGNTSVPDPKAPGLPPTFGGRWANPPWGFPRTPTQIANWNAVTRVHGLSNSDAAVDTGYTIEMCFNLPPMGYDILKPQGDIMEWNISIYDNDWFWPQDLARWSANRAWWESPWGNQMWYDQVQIWARPDVNVTSGPVPQIMPDYRVFNAAAYAPPTIDANLSDPIWSATPQFDIRYSIPENDGAWLRNAYPGVGPWRSGQYQPSVNGGTAEVVDPGDATVRWAFKNDSLYMAFDVRDKYVQYVAVPDRYDGFKVTINDRAVRYRDRNLETRTITFIVGPDGKEKALDYLPFLRDTAMGARIALRLKPGTALDTTGFSTDQGYTAELMLDLTKLGYPPGLGDRMLYIGVDLFDGDSFTPPSDSYGTRTWWYIEQVRDCCPAAAYLDPIFTTGVGPSDVASRVSLLGNFPNPFQRTTAIRYTLVRSSDVRLEVFDVLGRLVATRAFGVQPPGEQRVNFVPPSLRNGVYLYRLRIGDPMSGAQRTSLAGKMLLMK